MFTTPRLIAIALCAALNFAVGAVVYLVKLPIYMESIGTILCAMLIFPDRWAAFVCALIAGLASVAVIGLLVNPFLPWFSLTVLAIALISAFVTATGDGVYRARPPQLLAFVVRVVLFGVLTGVVAAIVSAPVVAYLFGGVTGSGSAFLVAFFLKTGETLMRSVLWSGLTADPIDKVLQVLIAALLFRATPAEFIAMVRGVPAKA
jgi:energy-coupling factor transport system substrate-specific component